MQSELSELVETEPARGDGRGAPAAFSGRYRKVLARLALRAVSSPELHPGLAASLGELEAALGDDRAVLLDPAGARGRPEAIGSDGCKAIAPGSLDARLVQSAATRRAEASHGATFDAPLRAGGGAARALLAQLPETRRVLVLHRRGARSFDDAERRLAVGLAHLFAQMFRFAESPTGTRLREAVLDAVLTEGSGLVWLTDEELVVRYVLALGPTPFDPYDRFLGHSIAEVPGLEEPIVRLHVELAGHAGAGERALETAGCRFVVRPVPGDGGDFRGVLGFARARVTTPTDDAMLRLHSTALEAAANAVLIADRDGDIAWVNPAFSKLTGYSREEALGQNPRLLKSEFHDARFHERLWSIVLSGRVWRGEMVNRRKDGSQYTELQTITPLQDREGRVTHFVAVKEDVSERKVLEEQFLQAQKMEAVGRLAGWVAHDFNNLLTAILGYTELLLLDTEAEDPRRPDLSAVKGAAERATSLTRQLLAFSRRQVLQRKTLDLNRIIAGLEKLLRRLIGEDIELVIALDESLGTAVADPGQIEQVIMNLAVNAREAMPNGGKLVVETANVELGAAYCATHEVVEPGSYVMVAVSDTGEGIEKEILPSIFEPFFTTKESRLCSGLGLSTVYGIVKQSGGYIWAYSERGIGSAFKVYLPRQERLVEGAEPPPARAARPAGSATETVLVVEDEDDVRRLALRVLREAGYRTLEARNGAEALLVAKEFEGEIELMLTDVIMPLMNGPEAAQRQAVSRPKMKVLYMSGYTGESIAQQGLLDDETPLLQKPFAPSTMLEYVRGVLDDAPR